MTFRILHVDDSPADVELIADAFECLAADVSLSTAWSGAEALTFLAGAGPELPHLVLLDLNLPQKSGREVLAAIKADSGFRALPVIVLTTSSASDDVRACYDLGANAFLTKPSGLDAVRRIVAAIHAFWIASNVYPALS